MTLKEFSRLNHDGRLEAADNAVCVAGRSKGQFMVLLYQLNSFYIEVYYHKQYRRIERLLGFDDLSLLDPYLEKIPVSVCQ